MGIEAFIVLLTHVAMFAVGHAYGSFFRKNEKNEVIKEAYLKGSKDALEAIKAEFNKLKK